MRIGRIRERTQLAATHAGRLSEGLITPVEGAPRHGLTPSSQSGLATLLRRAEKTREKVQLFVRTLNWLFSPDANIRIVRECLGRKVSISEAAREVGADYETVKMWVSIYENEGVTGFAHHGKKTYTEEMKEAAVKEYLQGGISVQSICRKYGIRDTHTFRKWIKVYNAHGDFSRITHSGGRSYMKQGRVFH